jgi:hypothetical protein
MRWPASAWIGTSNRLASMTGPEGVGRPAKDRFTLATMAVDTEPEGIVFHLLGNDTALEGQARVERSRMYALGEEDES